MYSPILNTIQTLRANTATTECVRPSGTFDLTLIGFDLLVALDKETLLVTFTKNSQLTVDIRMR